MPRQVTALTLDLVKSRCIECGDCWEWQGYAQNGSPQVSHNGRMVTVRKWVAENTRQKQKDGLIWSASCGNLMCVNPLHIVGRTPSRHGTVITKRRNYADPVTLRKITESRRKTAKLTLESAGAILSAKGERSREELASEYGVSVSTVNRIWRGEVWKQANALGVWSGLMS